MKLSVRPATPRDAAEIRRLIYAVRINPLALDWRRFRVAVAPSGELLGCGQVKPHADGTRELASIAVWPQHRGNGAARAVIERLLAENPPPLYLTCRASLRPLYERFGFQVLPLEAMPPYFHRIARLTRLLRRVRAVPEDLLVMRLI